MERIRSRYANTSDLKTHPLQNPTQRMPIASTIPHPHGERRSRGIQSKPSGNKGTNAVALRDGGQPHTFRMIDHGTLKEISPLATAFPSDKPTKTRWVAAMTTNPFTFGGVGGYPDSGSTEHLQYIKLVDWQFHAATLQDPGTGAFPVGPIVMTYSDIGCMAIGPAPYNIGTLTHSMLLPINTDPALVYTVKSCEHDEVIVHYSKDASARLQMPRIELRSLTGGLLTFNSAALTFELGTTQWN